MNKMIIPRKDHEVYFILLPENIRAKQILFFVNEQLDKLHPGFTSASALDLQHLNLEKKYWIMVTVMKAQILAEYKIMHKKTVFYTNTSILVNKKEFTQNGICDIHDERIGFDMEKKEPVSIPLDSVNNTDTMNPPVLSKTIPVRYGVFRNKLPKRRIAAMTLCALLMIIFTSAYGISRQNRTLNIEEINYIPPPIHTEQAVQTMFLPSAIEILADFSSEIVRVGGKILRWQFTEESEPLVIIQLQGISVLTAYQIFSQLEYLYLEDIRDVRYIDGEAHITVYLNTLKTDNFYLKAGVFPGQNISLPIINELTIALSRQEINIISEVLPSEANGRLYYTLTFLANDRNLIQSIEAIVDLCGKYKLRLRHLDLSISADYSSFTAVCTLTPCNYSDYNLLQVFDMSKIPVAFAYTAPRSLPLVPVIENMEIENDLPVYESIVGSIRDNDGNIVFFRDSRDGKIQVRVTYD